MSDLTQGANASQQWKESVFAQHEEDMLKLLRLETENISE